MVYREMTSPSLSSTMMEPSLPPSGALTTAYPFVSRTAPLGIGERRIARGRPAKITGAGDLRCNIIDKIKISSKSAVAKESQTARFHEKDRACGWTDDTSVL